VEVPTGPIRVHELALELNLTAAQVLSYLKLGGEFVRSASSLVTPPAARAVRERAQADRQRRAGLDRPRTQPVQGSRRPRATSPQPASLKRPGRAPLSDSQEEALNLAAPLFDVDRSALRPADPPRPPRGQSYEPMTPWRFHVFSPEEERAWTARGVSHPDQAFLLLEWGLTPRVLDKQIDGQTVAGWLRSGEGPGQVVARLRAHGMDTETG
jgi:hypothetical protein